LTISTTPPSNTQIEVTIFGPGYGESILIHLGDNKWIIIDSCIEPGQSEPAALEYLHSMGVDPVQSVVLVIASHWHDDHIRGLSQIVDLCINATFSCSLALSKKEFISAVTRYNMNNTTITDPGAKEIYKIYNILTNRNPKLAVVNTRIFSLASDELAHGLPISVWALSPSDSQIDRFLLDISSLIPDVKQTKRRATAPTPNHNSMVNLIEIGPLGILLGADLEEEGNADTGWSGIINNRDNQHNKSMIFKVAHHGSPTAHHAGIWDELLMAAPYAIITPWNRSVGLPSVTDINRIASLR